MADHLAAPTALEEHRKLAVFAGEWTGEEMVYPSRWTAGGPATSHVVARMDLNGYYSPAPASGGWTDKTLILVRGSLRGNARHVYEVVDNDSYTMKIQFSPDAEGWADVLTGTYRRIH